MFRLLGVLSFFATGVCSAALLQPSGTPVKTMTESGIEVPVHGEIKAILPELQGKTLYLTGAGLRTKKVAIVKVNVYIAAHYLDTTDPIPVESPASVLRLGKARAMQLTFLRDVTADQIRGAFTDSLTTNGVDTNAGSVKEVLAKINFDLPEKSMLTLIGLNTPRDAQTLWVESPGGTFSVKGKDLVDSFWKIWFAKPHDGGLEALQANLIGKSEK